MSNGCGCSKGVLRFIKPPYAKYFDLPCCCHDDDYDIGGDKNARQNADKQLFLRCFKLIQLRENNPYLMVWLTLIAMLYFVSVRLFGWLFFTYKK